MKKSKWIRKILVVISAIAIGAPLFLGVVYSQSADPAKKIRGDFRRRLDRARHDEEFNVLIRMKDRARVPLDVRQMRSAARGSQEGIDDLLEGERRRGRVRKLRKFWIVNMLSCTATEDVIDRLSQRDDVDRIYEDKIVPPPEIQPMAEMESAADISDDLTWGLDRINTSAFWGQGYYGSGVVIGSIDTGVYAEHPDLAGKMAAIGDGSIGWYDSFGKSPVPVDDKGHGTHTIGVAVGGSSNDRDMTIGVAPDAKYYSARIFMQEEETYNSRVLGAAEWMLDPDGDPSTDDAPDIIVGSWGSTDPGSDDEWFREMVRSWRNAGIIPIFAAGNKGPDPGSVSDPGNYPESFCVGAVDITDEVVDFSSRGPAYYDGREIIKPDIVAPGDYIVSALAPGSVYDLEYGSHRIGSDLFWIDGTSAAAPYVAGACALIKEKYPDLSVDDIIDLLNNTAADLGESVYSQGNGRLDLTEASEAKAVFKPGYIYLGENEDALQETWSPQAQIEIENLTQQTRTYTLSVESGLPEGLTAGISPSQVTLAPGGSAILTLSVSVDNTIFPDMLEPPYIYRFRIIAVSSEDTITAYFMFKNSLDLRLNLDIPCDVVSIHDQAEWEDGRSNVSGSTQLIINVPKPGIYDIIMTFREQDAVRFVIKEDVALFDDVDMWASSVEAMHQISVSPKDKYGNELPATGSRSLDVKHNAFPSGPSLTLGGEDVFISDLSSDYTLKWTSVGSAGVEFYFLNGLHEGGVTDDLILGNNPAETRHVKVKYNNAEYSRLYVEDFYGGSRDSSFGRNEPEGPFIVDYYFSPDQSADDPTRFSSNVYSDDFQTAGDPSSILLYKTQLIGFPDQNTIRMEFLEKGVDFEESEVYKTIYETHSNELFFGFGPPHFAGKTDNSNSTIILKTAYWGGESSEKLASTLYLNQMYDKPRAETVDYEVYRNNVLIDEGGIDLTIMPSWVIPARRGDYKIVLRNQYRIAGVEGQGVTTLEFNKSNSADRDPPYLLGLQIISNGGITESINTLGKNTIKFRAGDDKGGVQSYLYYRIAGGTWEGLPVQSIDGEYVVSLPSLGEGFTDIRITVMDEVNNSITYELTPAFKIEAGIGILLGDVTGNGEVTSYDASLAAQYAIGLISLTADAVQRADVTENGQVSSYDASLIAQCAIGLIDSF